MPKPIEEALTFDDVLLVPGYSEILPKDAAIDTEIAQGIQLGVPLLSAAMDTVTEARMAIAIAQSGGLGVIHKRMSAELQAAEVRKVKKYESGVVSDPITISSATSIRELKELMGRHSISGCRWWTASGWLASSPTVIYATPRMPRRPSLQL